MASTMAGRHPHRLVVVLLSCVAAAAVAQTAIPARSQDEALLGKLPPELRATAAAILQEQDPRANASALGKLASGAPGGDNAERLRTVAPFIVALVDARRCPENSGAWKGRSSPCLNLIAQALRRTGDAQLRLALESWAASHPDPKIATEALQTLLDTRMQELEGILRKRVLLARSSNDTASLSALGRFQEHLGSRLPAFLWQAPPKFEVRPASDKVRVVAIGDFGTADPSQDTCAATMLRYHRERPFDFGITLGDNYQDDGPHSPADARWHKYWERLYPALGLPFYVSLGNHDWGTPAGPAAAMLYQNAAWKFPSPYYTYTSGPVQFFVINTVLFSEAQRLWLAQELSNSTARWKIVYGHYQIYSALRGDNGRMIEDVLPVLEEQKADIYLCGHEHLFQHLKPNGRVHLFVNGAAGGGGRAAVHVPYKHVVFMAEKRQGFSILEADATALTVRFIDRDGGELYSYTLRK